MSEEFDWSEFQNADLHSNNWNGKDGKGEPPKMGKRFKATIHIPPICKVCGAGLFPVIWYDVCENCWRNRVLNN